MQFREEECSPTGPKGVLSVCGAECSLKSAQRVDGAEIGSEERNGAAEKK